MLPKKPKGRKPVKYKTITITITARQKRSLMNYCKSRRTTPSKMIKKAIRPLMENYADLQVNTSGPVKVNQLDLFE